MVAPVVQECNAISSEAGMAYGCYMGIHCGPMGITSIGTKELEMGMNIYIYMIVYIYTHTMYRYFFRSVIACNIRMRNDRF